MRITWAQALSWRLQRHFLTDDVPAGDGLADDGAASGDPVGVTDVVERLTALPAWSGDPDLAVRLRLTDGEPGVLDRAVEDGSLVRVFAFRGATHLMTPRMAAVHLPLRAAGRMWERTSWQEFYDLSPGDWPPLREAVREAVSDGPLTLDELGATVAGRPRYRHLREHLSEAGTFLKPFFWQGDLCFGVSRDGRPTVQGLAANPRWPGLRELGEAGPAAVAAYLSAYGPATPDHVQYWLGEGLGAGRARIRGWLQDLGDRLTEVDLPDGPALIPTELAPELATAAATDVVRLLAGHDQWVLGPGTAATQVVPPAIRPAVTRGANLVLLGGVVAGTWKVSGSRLTVTWAAERPAPAAALAEQVRWVAGLLDKGLDLRLDTA